MVKNMIRKTHWILVLERKKKTADDYKKCWHIIILGQNKMTLISVLFAWISLGPYNI